MNYRFQNMKHFLKFFTTLFIIAIMSNQVWSGAWVQKKEGYYLKISANYFETGKEFNYQGDKLNILEERLIYD